MNILRLLFTILLMGYIIFNFGEYILLFGFALLILVGILTYHSK